MPSNYYLAIDMGASSGRHILGSIVNKKLYLEEIYRFDNGMEKRDGTLSWNTEQLFSHILAGMEKCRDLGKIPVSVGIDTWGVDFVLLDQLGNRLGPAAGYRDHRTDTMDLAVEEIISQDELYRRTGVQKQIYNTIYQLMSVKKQYPEYLSKADFLLMTPDYYHYLLTGSRMQEYTIASTSQLVNTKTRDWDYKLMEELGLPQHIFAPLQRPGTYAGNLRPEIQETVGFDCQVILPPSHDTACAVLAVPSQGEDVLYISSGTWSLMGIELSAPNCSPEGQRAGFTNEGGYDYRYRYLKNIMGLWMIQSVKKEIGGGHTYGEICDLASRESIASLVDCNDSRFLSPDSMVRAVQGFCSETNQQVPETLGQMAAVIYNSLAKCYADTKKELEDLTGKTYSSIHIIGGGSQADYLNRLTAKYTGCRVYAGPVEATATGNILSQMLKSGELSSLSQARELTMSSFDIEEYDI